MVFVEGDNYRALRRPGDDPAQFRSVVRPAVRPAQVPAVPDSVVHQYLGQNFTTSTWADTAPSGPQADMSINGVSASTLNGDRAASSDGVDDVGLADGPQDLPENETFGVAMVINSPDPRDLTNVLGSNDGANGFPSFQFSDSNANDNSTGELRVVVKDSNNNTLNVETAGKIYDGQTRLIAINKTANTASGISIYVGDMTTQAAVNVNTAQSFDHTNYSNSTQMAFFAINLSGSQAGFKALDLPFIEFNEQPYSQQDRLDLKQRAPGV
jgi:hypothetical protein